MVLRHRFGLERWPVGAVGPRWWPTGGSRAAGSCLPRSVSICLRFVTTYQSSDAAWRAFADPSRRAIVDCLAEGSRSVRDLADELPISRPAVSQHLKVLKSAGLVTDRSVGTRRIYQINAAALLALRDQLDTYWNRALAAYQEVVEQSGPAPPPESAG